jgi:hypothetical protein
MDGTARSRTTISLARRAASLVLAALALGAAAAPARADEAPITTDSAAAAAEIAKTYWQATPCAGQVAVSWTPLDPATNATSTWSNPVSAYDAPEQNSACSIAFNSALEWDWTRYCSILVHEYGHLTGHAHAADERDVMYPYYLAPVDACAAAAPAQPAVEPDLTADAASLPSVEAVAAVAKSRHKRQRVAVLIAIREPRRLRGRPMHPRHHRVRMHRSRV